MLEHYVGAFRRYGYIDGRARRAEYWQFQVVQTVVLVALVILGAVIGFPFLYLFYVLAAFVPSLAVTVRRLQDTDRSGGWIFVALIPFVGGLVLLYLLCQEGSYGPNEYGPDPKGD